MPAASWYAEYVFKTTYHTPKGQLAAAPPPTWPDQEQPHSGTHGGSSWMVSSHTKHIKEAVQIARWMSTSTSYQATAPTYPAYKPAAEAWGKRLRGMVSISERPAEVEDRAVPGHWEGDLITGAANGSAIGTLVERASGFVMLLHLPHTHKALDVQEAMTTAMSRLPHTLRRTLTWDQGQEMANHIQIAAATDLDIYFCEPHSPWQRGTNENTNGLLRQYFPKFTDLPGYHRSLVRISSVRDRLVQLWHCIVNFSVASRKLDALRLCR